LEEKSEKKGLLGRDVGTLQLEKLYLSQKIANRGYYLGEEGENLLKNSTAERREKMRGGEPAEGLRGLLLTTRGGVKLPARPKAGTGGEQGKGSGECVGKGRKGDGKDRG